MKKLLMAGVALMALGSVAHAGYQAVPLQQIPPHYSCSEGRITDFPAEWRPENKVRVTELPYDKPAWVNIYPEDSRIELRIGDDISQYMINDYTSLAAPDGKGKVEIFLNFGNNDKIMPVLIDGSGDYDITLWKFTKMKTRGGLDVTGLIHWTCKP